MAGTFQQLKDLYKMQAEAKKMQKKMKKVTVKGVSRDGLVAVEMNGLNDILDIQIADELLSSDRKSDLIKGIVRASETAKKALQKELSQGFDVSDLQNMFRR